VADKVLRHARIGVVKKIGSVNKTLGSRHFFDPVVNEVGRSKFRVT
jgi:hypothetical protein